MKKLLMVVLFGLVVVGCKGKNGNDGAAGIQGLRGPGTFEMLTGPVASDSFTVNDSRIEEASLITVYLFDGNFYVEMPYLLPAHGVNAFPVIDIDNNQISIVNGQLAGATSYLIVLII